ncbi:calcium-responsive transcription factor-like [Lineus longissimus]|uniref:calcium-responsive transcription factor-like n=1 Tax=Lineus longissimus TaxID=88925 RepID=UPI002B4DD59E
MAEDGLVLVTSDTSDHDHVSQIPTQSEPGLASVENLVLHDGNGDTITVQAGGDTSGVTQADTTLHSLLTTMPGSRIISTSHGEAIQIVSLSAGSDLASITQGIDSKAWQLQVLPHIGSVADLQQAVITVPDQSHIIHHDVSDHDISVPDSLEGIETSQSAALLMPPPPPPQQPLPPGCPQWASRLNDCESIGDSYRGWVESEGELDSLLGSHKQQTQSFWGTRQSPCPAKPSTRLMWKSQYVPFDGIPFVNSGSRAVVMECQYGPRRKGAQIKRSGDPVMKAEFRQTCPARIYIKKVRKYPEYQVHVNLDKKAMKSAMDKAFQDIKQVGLDNVGMERFYIQLPTENAHEFHNDSLLPEECEPPPAIRLHPKVVQKIRDMVAAGETRVYAIRKQLRRFVEKEIYDGQDSAAEKHNLTLFPTVNDLQNHVHQALKDIEAGILQVTAPTVNVEVITSDNHAPLSLEDLQHMDQSSWQTGATPAPHAETVTVTLTQNPSDEYGGHIISRVETHLSDGTTQVSTSLTPETAQLLAKLHPNMFPQGNLLQVHDSSQASQEDGLSLQDQSHNTEESDAATVLESQTNSDNLRLVETDNSDTGALHVVKTAAIDSSSGTIHLIPSGSACANPTALQLVQHVSDGAALQLVEAGAGPIQLVQAGDSDTLQVMQLNQVIQNVHPLISTEALQITQASGDLKVDSNERLIKKEGHMSAADHLVSIDMEHESDGLVLQEESQFDDGEDD